MGFTEEDRAKYIDIMVRHKNKVKLDLMLELFTKEQLMLLDGDETVKKEIAEKILAKPAKQIAEELKLEELMNLKGTALKAFKEILIDPEHPKRFDVAKLVWTSEFNYLANKAKAQGETAGQPKKEGTQKQYIVNNSKPATTDEDDRADSSKSE